MINTDFPLTIYGLLARRWDTTEQYVGQIIRGDQNRKGKRGKGQAILRDYKLLQTSLDDWFCHTLDDGSLRVEMPHNVTVYVQKGVATVFKGSEILKETDVSKMTVEVFREYLNNIRIELK